MSKPAIYRLYCLWGGHFVETRFSRMTMEHSKKTFAFHSDDVTALLSVSEGSGSDFETESVDSFIVKATPRSSPCATRVSWADRMNMFIQ